MEVKQEFDPRFVRRFRLHQRVGALLHNRSLARRMLRRIGATFASLENDAKRHGTRLAHRTDAPPEEHGYTWHYGDIIAAVEYASKVAAPNFGPKQPGSDWTLYENAIKTMQGVLPDSPGMFNFGVCYAYVDSVLAREFPEKQFVGIDLSRHNAAFNEVEFGDLKNMTFLAGDVFDAIDKGDYSGWAFFHARTLCLLPRDFIERLYAKVRGAGFSYVVAFEPTGLSEQTGEAYTFDLTDRPSVYWRDRMTLHNYPGLAAAAGFTQASIDLFPTNHSSPDFRIFRMVARG